MLELQFILPLLIPLTTAQFPDHVDLQQIGETTYNNEAYKVLKPTVHKITDYFEEFMQRRQSRTNEKIFIDNDGFRHFWGGVGLKPTSLRKTDITMYEINRNLEAKSNEDDMNTSEEGIPILRNNEPATIETNPKPEPSVASDTNHEEKLRAGEVGTKKVAITSFFCPFLGVIRMTSVID